MRTIRQSRCNGRADKLRRPKLYDEVGMQMKFAVRVTRDLTAHSEVPKKRLTIIVKTAFVDIVPALFG
jgi:hypothetical protein